MRFDQGSINAELLEDIPIAFDDTKTVPAYNLLLLITIRTARLGDACVHGDEC